jgi:hypothetical protein
MTGFGAADGAVAGGWIRLEIRTVNHRHFNLATKLPGELAGLEAELRERLRREFDRGHVAVHGRWTEYPVRASGFAVDLERARLVTERLRELQGALGLGGEVTLELVARQPDVLGWSPFDYAPASPPHEIGMIRNKGCHPRSGSRHAPHGRRPHEPRPPGLGLALGANPRPPRTTPS